MASPENTRRGAQAYEALIRSRLTQGLPPIEERGEGESQTFEEFAEYWFKTYVETNNRPTTIRAKRNDLEKHLYPDFRKVLLQDISAKRIELLKAKKLKEGLSPKTVNNILGTLRTCLNHALEWEALDRVPRFKWLKVDQTDIRFLNEEECMTLLQHAPNEIIRDMLFCAMRTGMRRGELLGLQWSSVDFLRNCITVKQSFVEGNMHSTKNNRIRYIPMTADLRSLLARRKKLQGYVFSPTGKPVRGIRANKWIRSVCKRAGMDPIGWHTLRHTFASQLVMGGVPIRMVQAFLGHSSVQMTERYSHLAPSAMGDAISVLNGSIVTESENLRHYLGTSSQTVPAL